MPCLLCHAESTTEVSSVHLFPVADFTDVLCSYLHVIPNQSAGYVSLTAEGVVAGLGALGGLSGQLPAGSKGVSGGQPAMPPQPPSAQCLGQHGGTPLCIKSCLC